MKLRPKNGIVVTLDWAELTARNRVQPCAHAWVTDASIAHSLEHLVFDDPAVPHHSMTHRANRIASIVLMMEAGVIFEPLRVRIVRGAVRLLDGHHRLRAFQFRGKLAQIPVCIDQTRSKRQPPHCNVIALLRSNAAAKSM